MKKIISIIAAVSIMSAAVPGNAANIEKRVIKLNPSQESLFNNSEFEGWGTSMGWWGNRIGYSEKLSDKSAELFYSENGLGLDIVRYNVGGGDDPTHNHITRSDSKMPCFMNEDGTYNWDADYNQVNVLTKIKENNPDVHIEGYTNSPPWFMTESGCSGGAEEWGGENLAPENYGKFVNFVADVTEHFEEIGLKFDSYSPMNEPDTNTKYWGAYSPKQEGNHVSQGEHQSSLISALKDEYTERGIDTLVAGPEETSIDTAITACESLTDEAKSKLDRIDFHTYGGTKRNEMRTLAESMGKNMWMSEVDGSFTAGTDDYMKAALGLAQRIILDVNDLRPSAWVMWDIIDCHKDSNFYYLNENGEKIYSEMDTQINKTGGIWGVAMADHDTETIELTKKYYAYGQFTRYIKPGMTIISSSTNSLAAYDKDTGEIVIVVINTDASERETEIDLKDFAKVGNTARVIRTSSDEDWAELTPIDVKDKTVNAVLKPNSITTYVIENKPAAIKALQQTESGIKYKITAADSLKSVNKVLNMYNEDGKLVSSILNDMSGTVKLPKGSYKARLYLIDEAGKEYSIEKGNKLEYISINGADKLQKGNSYEYEFISNYDSTVEWSVTDPSIAEIDNKGKLTALKSGITEIILKDIATGAATSKTIEIMAPFEERDFSWMYPENEFVSNVPELSNDFTFDANGFEGGERQTLGVDYNGENTLYIQKITGKAPNSTISEIKTSEPVKCDDGESINISFDLYCPNSNGLTTAVIVGENNSELIKLTVTDWGSKYTVEIGGKTVATDGNAEMYLRNYTGGGESFYTIENGGHIDITINYVTGDTVLKLNTNSSNSAPSVEYEGNIGTKQAVTGYKFATEHEEYARSVLLDNLITNIIK